MAWREFRGSLCRHPRLGNAPVRKSRHRLGACALSRIDMSLTTFAFPTTVRFGPGAVNELPAELERRGIQRPLLVTDAGLARTPLFARVARLAPQAVTFTGVAPNPTEQNVLDGVEIYRRNLCDGIVGLGGGSPLDAAKAIRLKI